MYAYEEYRKAYNIIIDKDSPRPNFVFPKWQHRIYNLNTAAFIFLIPFLLGIYFDTEIRAVSSIFCLLCMFIITVNIINKVRYNKYKKELKFLLMLSGYNADLMERGGIFDEQVRNIVK